MQDNKPTRKRQRRCLACNDLFFPDPRTKGKQHYCSKPECQNKRQRKNEKDWRKRNPECVQLQYQQSQQWYKTHPDYSRNRRTGNPFLLMRNREQTRQRMHKFRGKKMFDKSKLMFSQLFKNKADRCYLNSRFRWLHIRLTKASPLSKPAFMKDNYQRNRKISNCFPQGKLYDLSKMLKKIVLKKGG